MVRRLFRPLGEPDCRQHGMSFKLGSRFIDPQQPQWQGHVIKHVEVRQDVKGLKDKAELMTANEGKLIIVKAINASAGEHDAPLINAIQTGNAIEQAGLATARLANDGNTLPRR